MTYQSNFIIAREDPKRVVLEGFHAIKHALRFDANIEMITASESSDFRELCDTHASDIKDTLVAKTEIIPDTEYKTLSPHPHRTGVIGIAKKKEYSFAEMETKSDRPIVVLDHPSHPDNVGASIRVAAAADAAGLILLGSTIDLWGPQVIRGAAGLHFALPVLKLDELPQTNRALVALDERGEPLSLHYDISKCLLVFGSERHGISGEVKKRVTKTIRIPMKDGVSSLNLATSVAVVLYRA